MKIAVLKNLDDDVSKHITITKSSIDTNITIPEAAEDVTVNVAANEYYMCLANTQSVFELQPFDTAILTYAWDKTDGRDLDTNTRIVNPDRGLIGVGYGSASNNKAENDLPYLNWGGDNTESGHESVTIDFKRLVEDYPEQNIFEVHARAWWWSAGFNGNIYLKLETYRGGVNASDGQYGFENIGGGKVQSLSISHRLNIQQNDVIPGVLLGVITLDPVKMTGQLIKVNREPHIPLEAAIIVDGDLDRVQVKSTVSNKISIRTQDGAWISEGNTDIKGECLSSDMPVTVQTGEILEITSYGYSETEKTTLVVRRKDKVKVTDYDPFNQIMSFSGGKPGSLLHAVNATGVTVATGIVDENSNVLVTLPPNTFTHGEILKFVYESDYGLEEGDTYTHEITVTQHPYIDYQEGDAIELERTSSVSITSSTSAPYIVMGFPEAKVVSTSQQPDLKYYWSVENATGVTRTTARGTSEHFVDRYNDQYGSSYWGSYFLGDFTGEGTKRIKLIVLKGNGEWPDKSQVKITPRGFDLVSYGRYASNVNLSNFTTEKHPPLPPTVTELVNSWIGNKVDVSTWDTSNVTKLVKPFTNDFNQDISGWDVSKVTNMDALFSNMTQFNKPLNAWDVSNVTSMSEMFRNTFYFNQDLSQWNTSNVTDMSYMFAQAKAFNGDISTWNTSNVTTMYKMFDDALVFNQPIGNWNISNVTEISYMFYNAEAFNQDIGNWDVSKITNLEGVFRSANVFNQDITGWDVSNVTNMNNLFAGAYAFNKPLNTWDVSNVTNMNGIFQNAYAFDQPLNNWDTSNVTDMTTSFYQALVFNQDISGWDVSKVTSLKRTFAGTDLFNKPLNNWNTSNVTNMESVFFGTDAFNQDLSQWDTSKVTTMNGMFERSKAFNGDISTWNTSNVTNMAGMFRDTSAFNGNISAWDVSNVLHFSHMFNGADVFNQDISGWDVSKGLVFDYMFSSSPFNQPIGAWIPCAARNMRGMFAAARSFNQDLSQWCVPLITSLPIEFDLVVASWTLPRPVWGTCSLNNAKHRYMIIESTTETSQRLYAGAETQIFIVDDEGRVETVEANKEGGASSTKVMLIGTLDNSPIKGLTLRPYSTSAQSRVTQWYPNGHAAGLTNPHSVKMSSTIVGVPSTLPANVTSLANMFEGCAQFSQDLSGWDTSNVTDMSRLFKGASIFNGDISTWDTSNVTNMSEMFFQAFAFNQPIGDWNTGKVVDMSGMFNNAQAFNQPIGNWNTSNVTSMVHTFLGAQAFNQPIGNWNTSNVTDMNGLFYYCHLFNQDIGNWNVSKVTNMDFMFTACHYFNHSLSSWCVPNITATPNSFASDAHVFLTSNYPVWGTCPRGENSI